MAEYNGPFADVSAIDLGAHAARGGVRAHRNRPAARSITSRRQRPPDLGRRDLRRPPRRRSRRASPRRSRRSPSTGCAAPGFSPSSRGPHRSCSARPRPSSSAAWRTCPRRRTSSAAPARGLRLGQGAARGLADGGADGPLLRPLHGADLQQPGPRSTASRARSRTPTPCASQQRAAEAWTRGRLAEEIVPVEVEGQVARRSASRRTTTCGPTRPWRASPALPPVFGKDGFVTAGNASGIVDGAARCS